MTEKSNQITRELQQRVNQLIIIQTNTINQRLALILQHN